MTNRNQRPGALDLVRTLTDSESFVSWDSPRDDRAVSPEYLEELLAAEASSGVDESIITGEALVSGHRVALAVSEFGFLGGSLGRTAATRLVQAIERASLLQLPFVGLIASGGTRMQEGTSAFVMMRDIATAMINHRRNKLASLVFLRHPTFGGALASWGSLATVTLAEEDASIGLLGARIHKAVRGSALSPTIQKAENYAKFGLVDSTIALDNLGEWVAEFLDLVCRPDSLADPVDLDRNRTPPSATHAAPADLLERSRRTDRPGVRDLIARLDSSVIWLRGSESHEHAGILCLARIAGIRVVVIGQDRNALNLAYGVSDLKLAQHGIQLAEQLGFPLLTVVDTPGLELSADAEEAGIAREIANTLGLMGSRTVPSVSVLLGQGNGVAALTTLGGDVVLSAESSWLAALPLEGAADLLFGDPARFVEAATMQRVGAPELFADGIVDRLIPEPSDHDIDEFCSNVLLACAEELTKLTSDLPKPPSDIHTAQPSFSV